MDDDLVKRLREKGDLYALEEAADEAADEIERLRAENERMREALEPFADIASAYDPPENDDDKGAWASFVKLGDIRRARSAIAAFDEMVPNQRRAQRREG